MRLKGISVLWYKDDFIHREGEKPAIIEIVRASRNIIIECHSWYRKGEKIAQIVLREENALSFMHLERFFNKECLLQKYAPWFLPLTRK